MIDNGNVHDYVKTGTTTMCRFTGDNAAEVRRFCAESDPEADGSSWGFVTADEFGSPRFSYRAAGVPQCPPTGGYDDTANSYRGDTPDAAVYDRVHGTWVPMWAGDFVARGPQGENYPVVPDPGDPDRPLKYVRADRPDVAEV